MKTSSAVRAAAKQGRVFLLPPRGTAGERVEEAYAAATIARQAIEHAVRAGLPHIGFELLTLAHYLEQEDGSNPR